ncbi:MULTISPECIES: HDOD domain-containing protein [Telluria group]|uniref:HDOD domain-containing protein n=1 Tax=Rugamonas aquatica TaxID=2743357 RepID=A0A6A7N457_9BURK|nr:MULTISPECIES: HDOD domain-containing protein [Telluria group]MQA39772.1 HDOD domain-containing protein [Rugamonas aquatica]OEZ55114.1 ribonuclease Y [Duganella sp. HH105]OFA02692.1 ribonuclease Y [Duganella sp. HH101]
MSNTLTYDDVVRTLDDLPSLPAVVMELLNSIDQDDVDISVLAKKVSYDQALTAKTLRLANSSLYGLQVKVTTIQQAITYLGFQTTRNLITAAAVTGCFAEGHCPGFDHKAFWRHSIATAACAKVLARQMRFNQDYAFTAGLLHDIGRLVLVSCFPNQYSETIAYREEHDCYLLEAERSVLGVDHVDAGMALAEHWNFSDTMRLAIGGHHDPEAPGAGFLAAIIHVADAIVHALDLAQMPDDLVPPVSTVAWTALGLDEEIYLQLFRETELQYEEISMVLLS